MNQAPTAPESGFQLVKTYLPVAVRRLLPHALLPQRATPGSACFDLSACFADPTDRVSLYAGESASVPTGLAFAVPEGHVMLLFPRSGFAFRTNTTLANSVGVIDSDYRGEVVVRLSRKHQEQLLSGIGLPLTILNGDRIAQALVLPVPDIAFLETDELPDTVRGTGGFGSTGAAALTGQQRRQD